MKNIFTGQAYSYTQGFNVAVGDQGRGCRRRSRSRSAPGFIWLFVSIVFGTLAAIKAGKYTDRFLTIVAMFGVSFPPFFLGAMLIYFLGYKPRIFPIGGYVPLTQDPLPVAGAPDPAVVHARRSCSSASTRACCARRSSTRSTRTTSARPTPRASPSARCCSATSLRNSLIPIISLWGLDMAQVIGGGAILTESVYNLHGVGQLAAESISRLDIITILVIVMLTAFAVVLLAARHRHPLRVPRPADSALGMTTDGAVQLLEVDDLQGLIRDRGRDRAAPSTASLLGRAAARSSRSSASPARASRSPR